MLDGMSDSIQRSRIENLHSREVDRQSPTGLIFAYVTTDLSPWQHMTGMHIDAFFVFFFQCFRLSNYGHGMHYVEAEFFIHPVVPVQWPGNNAVCSRQAPSATKLGSTSVRFTVFRSHVWGAVIQVVKYWLTAWKSLSSDFLALMLDNVQLDFIISI